MAALSILAAAPQPYRGFSSATTLRDSTCARAGACTRLIHGYQAAGGVLGDRELLQWLRDLGEEQPISRLARLIVDGRIVSFEGDAGTWFPRCQFELGSGHVRPVVQCVLAELDKVFDRSELAEWLITPSPWLADETPASLLASQPGEVLEAARIDRFLLAG